MENQKIVEKAVSQAVMDDLKAHIIAFFLKAWLYIVYVGIGLIGVFAEKIRSGKTMNFWQVISTAFIAIFVGYLASVYCFNHQLVTESAYIVPIATLLSDKIFISILNLDWKGFFNAVIDRLRSGKDGKQ